MIAAPFSQLTKSQNSPLRFQPVDQVERQRLAQQAQEVQRFGQQRQKLETNAAGAPAGTRTKEFVPAKVRLPGSPIVAKPGADLGKDRAPPKAYEAPKSDTKVEPKPRATRSADQPRTQPQPPPKVERQAPQPQPKAERQAPQPQPKAERQAPQPQPKVERSAPQPQPKAERQAPQPRDHGQADSPSAGSKQEKHQEKDKGKDKN